MYIRAVFRQCVCIDCMFVFYDMLFEFTLGVSYANDSSVFVYRVL